MLSQVARWRRYVFISSMLDNRTITPFRTGVFPGWSGSMLMSKGLRYVYKSCSSSSHCQATMRPRISPSRQREWSTAVLLHGELIVHQLLGSGLTTTSKVQKNHVLACSNKCHASSNKKLLIRILIEFFLLLVVRHLLLVAMHLLLLASLLLLVRHLLLEAMHLLLIARGRLYSYYDMTCTSSFIWCCN